MFQDPQRAILSTGIRQTNKLRGPVRDPVSDQVMMIPDNTVPQEKNNLVFSPIQQDPSYFAGSSLVTSNGTISYRSGYIITYPLDVSWARMQSLFNRSKGSNNVSEFAFMLKYTQSYATIKYRDAEGAMLGNLLVCSASDVSTIAKSLFSYLSTSKSLAGLESAYLGIMNTLGRRNDPLFHDGASLWSQLAPTCAAESVPLVDKELSSFVLVSGSKLSSLPLQLEMPGVNDTRFMGGLRGLDSKMTISNPIEDLISERAAASDGEDICKGIIQTTVAIVAALLSKGGGSTAGKVIGNKAASEFGEKLSNLVCGIISNINERMHDGVTTSPSDAGIGISAGVGADAVTPSDDAGTRDEKPPGDGGENDDEMPTDDSNNPGGPRSLGLNLIKTSSLVGGDGLLSLIALGPNGMYLIHGTPVLDIASGTAQYLGIVATSPDFISINPVFSSTNKDVVGKMEWEIKH